MGFPPPVEHLNYSVLDCPQKSYLEFARGEEFLVDARVDGEVVERGLVPRHRRHRAAAQTVVMKHNEK